MKWLLIVSLLCVACSNFEDFDGERGPMGPEGEKGESGESFGAADYVARFNDESEIATWFKGDNGT